MNKKISSLEKRISINFKDINLLKKSLIHKSFDNINNNEKLEFLGDRVLGLVLSNVLLKTHPQENEGVIDKKFANLVNKKKCDEISKNLELEKFILVGDSHKKIQKKNEKILSDTLEAIIGAIYLDQGINEAEKFIITNWKEHLLKSDITLIDAKTKLQEYSLKKFKLLPEYKISKQYGPKHQPTFRAEVRIKDSKKCFANGGSKKIAQQNAAKNLIDHLKI